MTYRYFKNIKTVIQFSDGSSILVPFLPNQKKNLIQSDIKSNRSWKNSLNNKQSDNVKLVYFNSYEKFFKKLKSS
jgi:hypothetical protein